MRSVRPVKKPAAKRAGKVQNSTTQSITSGAALHQLSANEINTFRKSLLAWYDQHRRSLPWRAPQGVVPDPYHVWLSEIMLQQTVVAAVIPYFTKFVEKWPTVTDLAQAPQAEVMKQWAGLGYYARARNLHKCAHVVTEEHSGVFPAAQEGLKTLPGVGDYTSAAITAIAFDRPATVVDGNVDRVVARYCAVEEPFPPGKKAVRQYAEMLSEGRKDRPGDFAQAMMDLGATICIPKAARCGLCPVAKACRGRQAGIQNELPRKRAAKEKPQKYGYVYWVTDKRGRVLLERRPETEMMGGMLALPVSVWDTARSKIVHDPALAGVSVITEVKAVKVLHSFTHFDLTLWGCVAVVEKAGVFRAPRYQWVAPEDALAAGLPSLFSKAVKFFHKAGG
ncbi:MAG: A/G-specific adenine glycosylase [Alphaproteobacteria bacterium]|nr:A/G-specific adenine glycosylase [Alphaproteobacteria bacterium]